MPCSVANTLRVGIGTTFFGIRPGGCGSTIPCFQLLSINKDLGKAGACRPTIHGSVDGSRKRFVLSIGRRPGETWSDSSNRRSFNHCGCGRWSSFSTDAQELRTQLDEVAQRRRTLVDPRTDLFGTVSGPVVPGRPARRPWSPDGRSPKNLAPDESPGRDETRRGD